VPAPVPTRTTLDATIRRGPALRRGSGQAYHGLEPGSGEPHLVRTERARRRSAGPGRSLAYLAHLTDIQLLDVQSPARLEVVHKFGRRPDTRLLLPMQRPQELLAAHATDALVRALNRARTSPLTGAHLQLALTTGDNVDNMQCNEVRSFLALLSGGRVCMNSGGPGYEGMQDGRYGWAWAPDDKDNAWGAAHGYPTVPGLLAAGLAPFTAEGLHVPWLTCYGNHDGLVQGRAALEPALAAILTGHRKVYDVPPGPLGDFVTEAASLFSGPAFTVTADPDRRALTRREFVEAHFRSGAQPSGHGLMPENLRDGTAYYAWDGVPGVRIIVLDTTNPAGAFEGSIDRRQLAWLEERLIEVHRRYTDRHGRGASGGGDERLVLVASHHSPGSMTNERAVPDGAPDAGERVLGAEVAGLLGRFPNVLAWISGHVHRHGVRSRSHGPGGFWEITTASVMEWPSQARLLEILDNGDGTLSLMSTTLDHDAPLTPDGLDSPAALASWHRELAANDPMSVGGFEAHGTPSDRNVELVMPDPRLR
jgi:metallophosphoesterase (TIGR03767 family)